MTYNQLICGVSADVASAARKDRRNYTKLFCGVSATVDSATRKIVVTITSYFVAPVLYLHLLPEGLSQFISCIL